MPGSIRRQRANADIWPGFVDALSALLIIILFLLMVFTLAQFFLNEVLSGRNQALDRLNREVSELARMLSLERSANEELRDDVGRLTGELQAALSAQNRLSGQLAELLPERDMLSTMLNERTAERDKLRNDLATAIAEGAKARTELADAYRTIEADRETIKTRLAEIASLERDIAALRKVRADLEKNVAGLSQTVKQQEGEIGQLRDRSKDLATQLADQQERTVLAQKEIDEKEIRLRELASRSDETAAELTEEQKLSADARREVQLLNRQLTALRQELARLADALDASEKKTKEQQAQIVDLGRKLNRALASKVEELARFRSEFFGRLRELLGNRSDIRIVGDRFVFQSEVLFASASAQLAPGGRNEIAKLASTLQEIASRIPPEINWVLRVDGHTDNRPIRTAQFPSNWELSSARAISVVKALIQDGIPAERLVAAGFGAFHPLDQRNDEIGYRRNRRIEFKLTER